MQHAFNKTLHKRGRGVFHYPGDNSACFPSEKKGSEPRWADKIGSMNPYSESNISSGIAQISYRQSLGSISLLKLSDCFGSNLPPNPFVLYLKSLQQTHETITQQVVAWAEALITNNSCTNLQSKYLFLRVTQTKPTMIPPNLSRPRAVSTACPGSLCLCW